MSEARSAGAAPRRGGRPDWLARASAGAVRQHGFSPAVARRLVLLRLRRRAQNWGFPRATAERLVFWYWLVRRPAAGANDPQAGEEVRR